MFRIMVSAAKQVYTPQLVPSSWCGECCSNSHFHSLALNPANLLRKIRCMVPITFRQYFVVHDIFKLDPSIAANMTTVILFRLVPIRGLAFHVLQLALGFLSITPCICECTDILGAVFRVVLDSGPLHTIPTSKGGFLVKRIEWRRVFCFSHDLQELSFEVNEWLVHIRNIRIKNWVSRCYNVCQGMTRCYKNIRFAIFDWKKPDQI